MTNAERAWHRQESVTRPQVLCPKGNPQATREHLRLTKLGDLVSTMQGEKKERWRQLCEQAAIEQNPAQLLQLVKEINDLLEEKERRLSLLPTSGASDFSPSGKTNPLPSHRRTESERDEFDD